MVGQRLNVDGGESDVDEEGIEERLVNGENGLLLQGTALVESSITAIIEQASRGRDSVVQATLGQLSTSE